MSQGSLVLELQHFAQDSGTTPLQLLRRCKVVATKLALTDINLWIQRETDGYEGPVEIPPYRHVASQLKFLNIVRGWIPVVWDGENPIQTHFAIDRVRFPISFIESEAHKSGPLGVRLHPKELELLRDYGNAHLLTSELSRTYSRSSFASILEAVREKILDWSLALEQRGILGNGMTFSVDERRFAATVVFNIGSVDNLIHGDHVNASQNSFSANQVGAQGPAATATRNKMMQQAPSTSSAGDQERIFAELTVLRGALAARSRTIDDAIDIGNVAQAELAASKSDLTAVDALLKKLRRPTWGVVRQGIRPKGVKTLENEERSRAKKRSSG